MKQRLQILMTAMLLCFASVSLSGCLETIEANKPQYGAQGPIFKGPTKEALAKMTPAEREALQAELEAWRKGQR